MKSSGLSAVQICTLHCQFCCKSFLVQCFTQISAKDSGIQRKTQAVLSVVPVLRSHFSLHIGNARPEQLGMTHLRTHFCTNRVVPGA